METPTWMMSHSLSYPCLTSKGFYYQKKMGADGTWIVFKNLVSGCNEPIVKGFKSTIGYGGRGWGVSSNGRYLVLCGSKGTLWKYDVETSEKTSLCDSFDGLGCPWISDDGDRVLFSAEKSGKCEIWCFENRQLSCLSKGSWYAWNPRVYQDQVVWSQWDEKHMPWEQSYLSVYSLLDEKVSSISKDNASLSYPDFISNGDIVYTSDEAGSRQLWQYSFASKKSTQLTDEKGEVYRPDWVCGSQPWAEVSDKKIVFIHHFDGVESLYSLKIGEKPCVKTLPTENMSVIDTVTSFDGAICVSGHHWKHPGRLLFSDSERSWTEIETARVGGEKSYPWEKAFVHSLSWKDKEMKLHGIFRKAIGKEKAPLLIHVHGGPTSHETMGWRPEASYWNLRGWHWLSVNHRGSTGYGRKHQEQLIGEWGKADVEDVCAAARYAIDKGWVEDQRVVIYGGSAGGWTVLQALLQKPDIWACGVALYPVSELTVSEEQTHRFEKFYNYSLVGEKSLWEARSPLSSAEKLQKPLLIFHGKEDEAVPHEQSVCFVKAAAQAKKIQLISLEKEGHGFSSLAKQKVWQDMEKFFSDLW